MPWKEDKATVTEVREWGKNNNNKRLPEGLTAMDSGKGKGAQGSSGLCKDQRCASVCVSGVHMDVHVLVCALMGASIQWHLKRIWTETIFQNLQNPSAKQNRSRSRGSECVFSIGQKPCQSSQGVTTVVKTQVSAQWIFGISLTHRRTLMRTDAHAHALSRNAWLINLGENTQITLNWCSVCQW